MNPTNAMQYPKSYENGNHPLALKDSALMEYSPREMAFVEYNPTSRQSPPTLRDNLRVLFRHKAMVFLTFLAVLATTYIGLELRTPLYETNVKLLIHAEKLVESPYYRDLDSYKTEVSLTQSEIVKSNPVLERTVRALKLNARPLDYEKAFASPLKQALIDWQQASLQSKLLDPEKISAFRFGRALKELKSNIRVKPINNTNLFGVSVRDFDPVAAATIANAVCRFYIIFDLEQQLAEFKTKYGEKHPAVMQFRSDIEKLQEHLSVEDPDSYVDTMGPASVKILERAPIPTEPLGFPKSLIMLLAALCGGCLGVAMAFLFEHTDSTIQSADDVSNYLNLPLLGSVPVRKYGAKFLKKEPFFHSRYAKSFESLADQIHVITRQAGLRSVLFTASAPGGGATIVTANVASYLSRQLGRRTLVIDANLRNPDLHRFFKTSADIGFAEVLRGEKTLDNAILPIDKQLSFLPAGKSERNPLLLFDPLKIREVLEKAGEQYEVILIDCSNLKNFKDTEVISAAADGVILVIEANRARRHAVRASLSALEQKRINLLGAVLNKRIFHVPDIIYDRV